MPDANGMYQINSWADFMWFLNHTPAGTVLFILFSLLMVALALALFYGEPPPRKPPGGRGNGDWPWGAP